MNIKILRLSTVLSSIESHPYCVSDCIQGFEKYFPNSKNGGPKDGEAKPSNGEAKGNLSHNL